MDIIRECDSTFDLIGSEAGVHKGCKLGFETFSDGQLFIREDRDGEQGQTWCLSPEEAEELLIFLLERAGKRER
jgi:hypothetical protein